MSKKQSLAVGAVFGSFTVQSEAPSRSGHAYWQVTCGLCQSVQPVRGYLLRKGLAICQCSADTTDTVSKKTHTSVLVSDEGTDLSVRVSALEATLAQLQKQLAVLTQPLTRESVPTPTPKPKHLSWADAESQARALIATGCSKNVVRPFIRRLQDIVDLDPFDEAKRAVVIELNRYLT